MTVYSCVTFYFRLSLVLAMSLIFIIVHGFDDQLYIYIYVCVCMCVYLWATIFRKNDVKIYQAALQCLYIILMYSAFP